jgi:cysteine desulfurase / selenocysteine lyase
VTRGASARLRAVRPEGALDVAALRRDFPILRQLVRGRPLVYLDNAATTQKPRAVLDAMTRFYTEDNANVHRGVHLLSERATAGYEVARRTVQRFLGASDPREIVFVRGATEGINLVAQTLGRARLQPGDEVLISTLEHHSNIVPWQMVCQQTGATLKVIPINDAGEVDLEAFERLLTARTKLVSVVHVSNALGTIVPVAEITRRAHARNVPVLVDGAQAVSHVPVDVRQLDCDFYAFSGHKVFGPTGIGVLYGRSRLLEAMPPYQGGGDMISSVTFERTDYNSLPYRFEAGTPDIAGAIGLAAALDYLSAIGLDRVAVHERELLAVATERLSGVPGVRIVGTAAEKAAIVSFVMDGIHPHDIGTIVDREGVAIRTGHHCCQPLMHRLGVDATARASFALYNTTAEVDALVAALHRVREIFQ